MDSEREVSTRNASQLIGYTLLDSYCTKCFTPLMRLRNEESFCVLCSNLPNSSPLKLNDEQELLNVDCNDVNTGKQKLKSNVNELPKKLLKSDKMNTLETLQRKLNWAVDQLDKNESVSECIQLCALIKACSDTIKIINETNADTVQIVNGSLDD
ncbi:Sjoegren syndrome/scleroderma autoantigen 1-like protein [Leptotrombidium deliense]|uniref:Sjoegren syndrome/scleroderma autoantigen 1-like protein n=1 Tax=Leptotrombidium deliense TaxID=299467 RepID=A0A443STB6_9ACAR|nr:Sjoegren syndrome/scleroderma autoantigen 1-like protein [Leptotrombidium deliense]